MSSEGGDSRRVIYGVNPILEALRARPSDIERLFILDAGLPRSPLAEIISRAQKSGLRVTKVARERMASLAEGGRHQGVLAQLKQYAYVDVESIWDAVEASGREGLILVLDGVSDPQNFGAAIRSAHALGVHGIVIAKDRAVPVTGAVAKASAGAIEHSLIAKVVNISRTLEELKERGYWVVAAEPASDALVWEAKLSGPLAVVVGAEGAGVRDGVLKHCDYRVKIPMFGQVASLNVSVATALLLYEIQRQRRAGARER